MKKKTLALGARALIPTGLVFHLCPGFEAQIRPLFKSRLKTHPLHA
ncbi:dUTPase [Bartonella silvatica]|uniref:dUTPase n=1 Tax=Bartonella silvatica TaxID=357760 RepID=A0ABV2HHD8_9HYPH